MTALAHRLPMAVVLVACSALLGACFDRSQESTRQDVDRAVDKTQETTMAAARKAAELAETARDKTRDYLTSPEVKQDAAAAKNAIRNLGAAAVETGDDAAITRSVAAGLAKDDELKASRIDIVTRGGAVRLAGPAPSAAAKARAGEIAKSVAGVSTVDNQLVVNPG